MNIETGEIKNFSESEIKSLKEAMSDWVEISEEDMTDKQKKSMQVSKHDNKSKLGKLFTEYRKKGFSGLTKNQKRNLKKKMRLQ